MKNRCDFFSLPSKKFFFFEEKDYFPGRFSPEKKHVSDFYLLQYLGLWLSRVHVKRFLFPVDYNVSLLMELEGIWGLSLSAEGILFPMESLFDMPGFYLIPWGRLVQWIINEYEPTIKSYMKGIPG